MPGLDTNGDLTPQNLFVVLYILAWSFKATSFYPFQFLRIFSASRTAPHFRTYLLRFLLGFFCMNVLPFLYLIFFGSIFNGVDTTNTAYAAVFFAFTTNFSIQMYTRLVVGPWARRLYPDATEVHSRLQFSLFRGLNDELAHHTLFGDLRAFLFYGPLSLGMSILILSRADRQFCSRNLTSWYLDWCCDSRYQFWFGLCTVLLTALVLVVLCCIGSRAQYQTLTIAYCEDAATAHSDPRFQGSAHLSPI